MSKGNQAIQQAQTEIEQLSQTDSQVVGGVVSNTGQTTSESFFYTKKKFIDYKTIYKQKYL